MIITRKDLEEREERILAPYAVKSSDSRGRENEELEAPFRTCFQHDRDRVIHSKAFRRLKGKTQVFVAHYGDHYRSRLAHSMEVAQISRDLARMLGLNEDLAEVIALAHDLGHTPFGHAGQDAMNEMMQKHGEGFEHNEQSRRVVEFLEQKKPEFRGLNLCFEVLDGLIKHRTRYDKPAVADTKMPSLEAQIVNLADEIAYQNHDIDDAIRSGLLSIADFSKLKIWKRAREGVDQHMPDGYLAPAMVSALMSLMINDLAQNTDRLVSESGVQSVDEIYQTEQSLSDFSDDLKAETIELKDFLYKNFYQSAGVHDYNVKGMEVIKFLFEKMMTDTHLLPEKVRQNPYEEPMHVLVKDYIAGMTDQFAFELYQRLK